MLDGRYRLQVLLGQGGSAQVFRATDLLLDRPVAVKIYGTGWADAGTVTRQRTEMQVLAGLSHPNLVGVYDARVAEPQAAGGPRAAPSRSYLVMELVDGATLAARLSAGPMSLADVTAVGTAVATALAEVHARSLVHRDVKPGNILLSGSVRSSWGTSGWPGA